jgi:hypothetical protein
MKRVLAWLQQPTSVAGLSAISGTIAAVVLHQIDVAHAVPLLAAAIVSILLPDNAGARGAAEMLTRELVAKLPSGQEKT